MININNYIFLLVIIAINITIYGSYTNLEDSIRACDGPNTAYLLFWNKNNISSEQKQQLLILAEERINTTYKELRSFRNTKDLKNIFNGLLLGYTSYKLMKPFLSESIPEIINYGGTINPFSLIANYTKLYFSGFFVELSFRFLKDGLLFKNGKNQYESAKKIKNYIETII